MWIVPTFSMNDVAINGILVEKSQDEQCFLYLSVALNS